MLKHLVWYRVMKIDFSGTWCIMLKNNLDLLVRKCTILHLTYSFSMVLKILHDPGSCKFRLVRLSMILNYKCTTQGHANYDWFVLAWGWNSVHDSGSCLFPLVSFSMILNNKCITQGHANSDWSVFSMILIS